MNNSIAPTVIVAITECHTIAAYHCCLCLHVRQGSLGTESGKTVDTLTRMKWEGAGLVSLRAGVRRGATTSDRTGLTQCVAMETTPERFPTGKSVCLMDISIVKGQVDKGGAESKEEDRTKWAGRKIEQYGSGVMCSGRA